MNAEIVGPKCRFNPPLVQHISYVLFECSLISWTQQNNILYFSSGIYAITCKCVGQYSGKTTVGFNNRFPEHWNHKSSSVYKHLEHYKCTNNCNEIKMQFLENVWGRGKYSLSEREFLWNKRLKGVINIQKTLRN